MTSIRPSNALPGLNIDVGTPFDGGGQIIGAGRNPVISGGVRGAVPHKLTVDATGEKALFNLGGGAVIRAERLLAPWYSAEADEEAKSLCRIAGGHGTVEDQERVKSPGALRDMRPDQAAERLVKREADLRHYLLQAFRPAAPDLRNLASETAARILQSMLLYTLPTVALTKVMDRYGGQLPSAVAFSAAYTLSANVAPEVLRAWRRHTGGVNTVVEIGLPHHTVVGPVKNLAAGGAVTAGSLLSYVAFNLLFSLALSKQTSGGIGTSALSAVANGATVASTVALLAKRSLRVNGKPVAPHELPVTPHRREAKNRLYQTEVPARADDPNEVLNIKLEQVAINLLVNTAVAGASLALHALVWNDGTSDDDAMRAVKNSIFNVFAVVGAMLAIDYVMRLGILNFYNHSKAKPLPSSIAEKKVLDHQVRNSGMTLMSGMYDEYIRTLDTVRAAGPTKDGVYSDGVTRPLDERSRSINAELRRFDLGLVIFSGNAFTNIVSGDEAARAASQRDIDEMKEVFSSLSTRVKESIHDRSSPEIQGYKKLLEERLVSFCKHIGGVEIGALHYKEHRVASKDEGAYGMVLNATSDKLRQLGAMLTRAALLTPPGEQIDETILQVIAEVVPLLAARRRLDVLARAEAFARALEEIAVDGMVRSAPRRAVNPNRSAFDQARASIRAFAKKTKGDWQEQPRLRAALAPLTAPAHRRLLARDVQSFLEARPTSNQEAKERAWVLEAIDLALASGTEVPDYLQSKLLILAGLMRGSDKHDVDVLDRGSHGSPSPVRSAPESVRRDSDEMSDVPLSEDGADPALAVEAIGAQAVVPRALRLDTRSVLREIAFEVIRRFQHRPRPHEWLRTDADIHGDAVEHFKSQIYEGNLEIDVLAEVIEEIEEADLGRERPDDIEMGRADSEVRHGDKECLRQLRRSIGDPFFKALKEEQSGTSSGLLDPIDIVNASVEDLQNASKTIGEPRLRLFRQGPLTRVKLTEFIQNDAHFHPTNYSNGINSIRKQIELMDAHGVQISLLAGIPSTVKKLVPEARYYAASNSDLKYSSHDHDLIMQYLQLSEEEQNRFILSTTRVDMSDLASMETEFNMSLRLGQGKIRAAGEITLIKEIVTAKNPGDVPSPTSKQFWKLLDICALRGLPLVLHCDRGTTEEKNKFADDVMHTIEAWVIKNQGWSPARKLKVCWAHAFGISRFTAEGRSHTRDCELVLSNPTLKEVLFGDVSWDFIGLDALDNLTDQLDRKNNESNGVEFAPKIRSALMTLRKAYESYAKIGSQADDAGDLDDPDQAAFGVVAAELAAEEYFRALKQFETAIADDLSNNPHLIEAFRDMATTHGEGNNWIYLLTEYPNRFMFGTDALSPATKAHGASAYATNVKVLHPMYYLFDALEKADHAAPGKTGRFDGISDRIARENFNEFFLDPECDKIRMDFTEALIRNKRNDGIVTATDPEPLFESDRVQEMETMPEIYARMHPDG